MELARKTGAIASSRRASRWAVVASGSQYPITGGGVMFTQQRGGHGEISVRIEGFAGAGKALPVITQVGLSESNIDPLGAVVGERLNQGLARRLASDEAIRCSGDIQCPRPGQQPTSHANTTLLQGDGEKNSRRNVCTVRRQLIGRRRQFVRMNRQCHERE
ncbi:hypothetical protein VM99_24505 [Pseudomonas chlororaphis]|uniref:Uncharacterized protein n=1 Tax=Pseudomonas chlororaphis TaxID=587753 RepID=A0A0G3GNB8_9PSED|nr:hypothetical protein VM99_24505 [Pseudomonas chlororaphis]